MALEDEFGVTIAEESAEELGSIDQLVGYISARKQA
jgi:acyl carrier protein